MFSLGGVFWKQHVQYMHKREKIMYIEEEISKISETGIFDEFKQGQ